MSASPAAHSRLRPGQAEALARFAQALRAGSHAELIGVPFEDLRRLNVPEIGILEDEFAFNDYYSAEKLFRDVPEFHPQISLEQGMTQVFEVMEREGRIPNSDELKWEDEIVAKYKTLWK